MPKSPAFRFYPSDFVGSPTVQAMDLHEIGAYTLLLCIAWNAERHGYLPDDENLLRRWARMTREQWAESRVLLLSKFPIVGQGWRANPRMVEEANKQQVFSESQSKKGAMGGRPRKNQEVSYENPELLFDKPDESHSESPEKPSVSVSVSAFVSDTASAGKEQIQEHVADAPPVFSKPKKSQKKPAMDFILPEWIPCELWEHWVNNRKAIRKPISEYAKTLAVKDLEKYRDQGYDISAILNEAILKNWLGLFVNASTPKVPVPKKDWKPSTQRELDEQNFKDFGSPPPEEWAPEGAPQGWVPCRS